MDHRDEVRAFLTSRRARLTPADVGLPRSTGHRRVAGLRRDEVAVLAGVSSEYYARLERGNLAGASDAVLTAICQALRLDEAETQHLHNLADATSRPTRRPRPTTATPTVRPSVQRIVDAIGSPAYVHSTRSDVLAANSLARALLAPVFTFAALTGAVPNTARFAFLDPGARTFYPDYERVTRDSVAALNAAAGHDPYDRQLTELIGELSTRSEVFRTLWASHDVRLHRTGAKRLHHPQIGTLTLDYDVLQLTETPKLHLVVYTAGPGTADADGLTLLASLAAGQTASAT